MVDLRIRAALGIKTNRYEIIYALGMPELVLEGFTALGQLYKSPLNGSALFISWINIMSTMSAMQPLPLSPPSIILLSLPSSAESLGPAP